MTTKRPRTLLLFGAPGAGKGTQGQILGSIPGFFHLSCGEVFRTFDSHTELGKLVCDYTSRGELVPDEITVKIWRENIRAQEGLGHFKPERDLLVLDGIPRNIPQAKLLDSEIDVRRVIHLVCEDKEQMIERLRRRALIENRADDAKEDVIRHRWNVYEEETLPILERRHYDESLVRQVDASAPPTEVLIAVLNELPDERS